MRKDIILKDIDNKKKTITIGEPFLRDGTFWLVTHLDKEVLPSVRISMKDVDNLLKFLQNYKKMIIKEYNGKRK